MLKSKEENLYEEMYAVKKEKNSCFILEITTDLRTVAIECLVMQQFSIAQGCRC